MADHLTYNFATGHLQYSTTTGHLSYSCGGETAVNGYLTRIIQDVDGQPMIVFIDYISALGQVFVFTIRASSIDSAGSATWDTPVEVFRYVSGGGAIYGSAYADATVAIQLGTDSTVTIPNNVLIANVYHYLSTSRQVMSYADATVPTDYLYLEVATNTANTLVPCAITLADGTPCLFEHYDVSTAGHRKTNIFISDDLNGETSYTKYNVIDDTIPFAVYQPCRAELIDGNPALLTTEVLSGGWRYVRASAADGTTWNAVTGNVAAYTGSTGVTLDMKEYSGVPAVIYMYDDPAHSAFSPLLFRKGTDANASSWTSPVAIPVYDADSDVRYANGYGSVESCALCVVGGVIVVFWALTDHIPVYDTVPTCITFYGYSYCYYEIIGYKIPIFRSESSDGGATWSTPTEEWVHSFDVNESQSVRYLDVTDDQHVVWTFYSDSAGNTMYYNGELVAL